MKHKPNWIIRRELKMLAPEKAKSRIEEAVMLAEWHKAMAEEGVKYNINRNTYETRFE